MNSSPTTPLEKPQTKRLLELDVLRFAAVALVLGRHMIPCSPEVSSGAAAFSRLWLRGGWIGVDMFFVLSGFLVSGLLFREFDKYASVDMTRFLIRRAFKIYPAFWALIAATLALGWVGYPMHDGHTWSELLFVQNYFPGLWSHTWSLAVEEHFYLLLAALVTFLIWRKQSGNDPLSAIPMLFCFVAVVCLMLRVITTYALPYHHQTHLFPTHLRIDSLMFGVLLAYSWHRGGFVQSTWVRQRASQLIGYGVLLLLPAFVFPLETTLWIPVFGLVSFYVGSGAILIGLLHRGLPNCFSVRSMSMLGAYSYSIYLWHSPVHNWFVPLAMNALPTPLQGNWFVYATLFVIGSFLIGVLMGKLIEAPVLALRDKWFPSRSKALARQAEKVVNADAEPNHPRTMLDVISSKKSMPT
jgi:peptidoglycan/LPS O-acetylase OafA/YrhL